MKYNSNKIINIIFDSIFNYIINLIFPKKILNFSFYKFKIV